MMPIIEINIVLIIIIQLIIQTMIKVIHKIRIIVF